MAPVRAKAKAKTAKRKVKPKRSVGTAAGKKKRTARVGDWRVTCTSLGEIRRNIDALDAVIVPLLCRRLHFVTQAANFKPSVAGVIVPSRVEEIIASVRAGAKALGTNPDTIETVYRALIDAFTADEQRHWKALHR